MAMELGFAGCDVSKPMRRYQVLDLADVIGNPALADSAEWKTVMSMMRPSDSLRHVRCENGGDNFFGLYRGNTLLVRFGSMIND